MSWAALLPDNDIRADNWYYDTANYGHCTDCEEWFPWTARVKKIITGKKVTYIRTFGLHSLHKDVIISSKEEE